MKQKIRTAKLICLLGSALALAMWARPSAANFYNESCQIIRLHGTVQEPPLGRDTPLELTLAYQLNYQSHPEYLKINLPLGQSEFQFTITGFHQREAGDIFIPQIFWYPREVKFHYYVKSADGHWVSETRVSTYQPAATKVEENTECEPDLYLDPLTLKKIGRYKNSKGPEGAL